MSFPFTKPSTDSAPTTSPVAEVSNEDVTNVEVTNVEVEKKERKKQNRQATREIAESDIQFVMANVKTKSYTEMAEQLGITKFQVNRILMEIKKGLRDSAKGDDAKTAKVEAYIKEHLSRPEDARPGASKGGGRVKGTLNNLVADILGNL